MGFCRSGAALLDPVVELGARGAASEVGERLVGMVRRVSSPQVVDRRKELSAIEAALTRTRGYEIASTTNGSDRPSPNSAPPNGGPASRTAATRPVSAAAAAGSCRGGTTARSTPAWAPENSAEPQPSMNPTTRICQNGGRWNTIVAADHRKHAHAVGEDHQAPPVPAVGRKPCGQCEDRPGHASRKGDYACLRGRVGDREHEQRICDRRRLRPCARQQLPRL